MVILVGFRRYARVFTFEGINRVYDRIRAVGVTVRPLIAALPRSTPTGFTGTANECEFRSVWIAQWFTAGSNASHRLEQADRGH